MANKNSLLKQLTSALLVRDVAAGGGNTTLSVAATKGTSIVTLTSATNFAVGDTVRIGSGSQLELAVLVAGQVSPAFALAEPLGRDHAIGEAVVEQAAYDVGDITDAGVDVTGSRESNDVVVATRRLNYAILLGNGDLEAGFTLPGLTMENIALALGIPLSKVVGSGASSTTPKHIVTDLSDIATELNASMICTGILMDGTPVRVELWGADPDYTGFSVNLRRGSLAGVPARFIATAGGRVSANASSYVANTTYRANKGKIFDSLTEVGYFTNGATAGGTGGSSTTTAQANAGQAVMAFTAVTNFSVGDWVKVGSGDLVEFHRIASIAVNNVTFDTNLLRTWATGTTVVEQQLVPFANIANDGVTLAFSGTVDRLREATKVFSIGTRPGTARASVSFNILDFTPSAIARALGLDPATIVSNQFVIDEKIGTNITDGIYCRGVLQDGTTSWMVLYGSSQELARAAFTIQSTGQPSVPTSWVPSSGLLLMQHT